MNIFLVRHGESPMGPIDESRVLNQNGRNQSLNSAIWLSNQLKGHKEIKIIHSPYTRAKETAYILKEKLEESMNVTINESEHITPNSNPESFSHVIEDNSIYVTHMPFISDLTRILTRKNIAFPTAGTVKINNNTIVDQSF